MSAVKTELGLLIQDGERLVNRARTLLDHLDDGGVIQVPRQGPWTKQMLVELWPRVDHLPGIVALFEVCADHPNEIVTYSQVLERSGLNAIQQKNEHARLSRVTAELFGEKRWPIQAWQGSPTTGGTAEMLYRMGGTVATWWIEISGHAG